MALCIMSDGEVLHQFEENDLAVATRDQPPIAVPAGAVLAHVESGAVLAKYDSTMGWTLTAGGFAFQADPPAATQEDA